MRCLMGLKHRERLVSFVPPGGRMLEWGAGGSTVWLARNLPEGATLTSIEHDREWFYEVANHLGNGGRGPRDNVRMLLREPTGPLGANATAAEDDPTSLQPFIDGADGERFDVILVDGYARGACLERARSLLNPGGVVVLHDAQREWYDTGKALFAARGHMGSCPDYPGPELWWGTNSGDVAFRPARATLNHEQMPIVLCYFTLDTPYADEAKKLKASCLRLGLEHRIVGVQPRGSWEANCAYKARFVEEQWRALGRPVLWVDADAIVHRTPDLLRGVAADFAVHRALGWMFASGTVFFNQTPGAEALLVRWRERCEADPGTWDQVHLDAAWEDVAREQPLETLWLPREYTFINDLEDVALTEDPVIEHTQASRRYKATVSAAGGVPEAQPVYPEDLIAARRASRARAAGAAIAAPTAASQTTMRPRVTMKPEELPVRIKIAMVDRLALECVQCGVRRIALYGAGRHTQEVALWPLRSRGIEVVAILDDAPKMPTINDIPVVRPSDLDEIVDAVIVSSDWREEQIAEAASEVFGPRGVPVLRIYRWEARGAAETGR
ncbi:MAG: class I SAM-dependent methyltransferase [Phycisphaeraceae bacterium]|nr:class I SAM-dependent methyltransferase [Phycisphaeraceae bacterium]